MEFLILVIILIAILLKEKFQEHSASNYADYAQRWKEQNVPKRDGESNFDWSTRADRIFKQHEKLKK